MRIFLVDDDDVFNYIHSVVIGRVLPDADVRIFKSGEEVKVFLEAKPAVSYIPELILLDIRMPDMDGFELIEYLQNNHPEIINKTAIYLLSSTLDERDLQRANDSVAVKKFLSKPLSIEIFQDILNDIGIA